MKTFRTIVSTSPSPVAIGPADSILLLGSCFADAIGERLRRFKFKTLVNPYGVIYNPLSIHKVMQYAAQNRVPAEDSYVTSNEIHLNFDLHSEVSALDRSALEEKIRTLTGEVHHFVAGSSWLLITYGTAWAYRRQHNGEVVANCHKQPQDLFSKSLLSPADIVASFRETHALLKKINPAVRFILTVSPVRHLKDSLELNSVSKAVLRLACHQITETVADTEYFPAFEMMLDDLRDYRFYDSDMLHPTDDAGDYIWDAFAGRYFSSETQGFIKEWNGILSAMQHRAFHPESAGHQQFLRRLMRQLEAYRGRIDVDAEVASIKKQLL